MKVFCTYCGAANAAGVPTCIACGTPLDQPGPPATQPGEQAARPLYAAGPIMPAAPAPPEQRYSAVPGDAMARTSPYEAMPYHSLPYDAQPYPPSPAGAAPYPPRAVTPWLDQTTAPSTPYAPPTAPLPPYPPPTASPQYPPPYPRASTPPPYPYPYGSTPLYPAAGGPPAAYQQQQFYGQSPYAPPYSPDPTYGPGEQFPLYAPQPSSTYPPYAVPYGASMPLAQSGPGSLATTLPRFGAFLFDLVIYGVLAVVLLSVAGALGLGGLGALLALGLHPLYFIGFWSTTGQTPGYRAAGLQLVKTDGTRPGVGASSVRYIGWHISQWAFYLGCLWMIWDYQKQTWHDKMASTLVIRAQ